MNCCPFTRYTFCFLTSVIGQRHNNCIKPKWPNIFMLQLPKISILLTRSHTDQNTSHTSQQRGKTFPRTIHQLLADSKTRFLTSYIYMLWGNTSFQKFSLTKIFKIILKYSLLTLTQYYVMSILLQLPVQGFTQRFLDTCASRLASRTSLQTVSLKDYLVTYLI